MKRYYPAALCLLVLQFSQIAANAQNCNCIEYYQFKADVKDHNGDSKKYIRELAASGNDICQARSFEWEAIQYVDEGKLDSAEIFFLKAQAIYKRSSCGDSILLNTYKNWAELYYRKGDFGKAQEYSFLLMHSAEAAESPYEIAGANTMIAQMFNQTGQAEKGIGFTQKAAALLSKITDKSKQVDIMFKLAKRYLWHYQDIKVESSLDSSELFTLRMIPLCRELNNTSGLSKAFANLEGIAYEKEEYEKGIILLDSSFKYIKKDEYDNLGTNYYDKADLFMELKRYDEAIEMADSCLYYRKISGNPAYTSEAYDLLSGIAVEKGDFKSAYENKELSRAISDSIRNVAKAKQVAELEKKYNQAKNEKTIRELAQQKRIYLLLAVAGLLGLATLIFFLRQQSLRNKQKILETEQRLNRARMNPHFFFNALSSLQAFALEGNDGKSIASNLSKFSHIMRETLESTYKDYITLEQETDFLKEYLELQKIRFPQKFDYAVVMDETIEPDELVIPSMILQPFVENSIEHGFAGISYPGNVHIDFTRKEKDLHISIRDNGKGLAASPKENSEHISRASQIIRDRIFLLNIRLKTRASFTIDNNSDGNGVLVKIILPVLFKEDVKES